jgi:hypothetical protein
MKMVLCHLTIVLKAIAWPGGLLYTCHDLLTLSCVLGHGQQPVAEAFSFPAFAALFVRTRRGFVCHAASSSLVVHIGALKRDFAHCNASAHLYKGREPNFWNGGPPPLTALVARVAGLTGKPAAVSAAAVALRVNRASGLSGIMFHHRYRTQSNARTGRNMVAIAQEKERGFSESGELQ